MAAMRFSAELAKALELEHGKRQDEPKDSA